MLVVIIAILPPLLPHVKCLASLTDAPLRALTLTMDKKKSCGAPSLLLLHLLPVTVDIVPDVVLVRHTIDRVNAVVAGRGMVIAQQQGRGRRGARGNIRGPWCR